MGSWIKFKNSILSNLIESNADSFSFLVGGMGKFDRSNLGEDCEVGKFRLDRDNEEC